jgi:hypothetical protein
MVALNIARLYGKSLRSRGWNREPNNTAISRIGSRFHSRRRKCQVSLRRICTIQPTRPERRRLQIASRIAAISAKPIPNRKSNRTEHRHSQFIAVHRIRERFIAIDESPTKIMSKRCPIPITTAVTGPSPKNYDFKTRVIGGSG